MTTITISDVFDVEEYPDTAGEYLRSVFFDQGPLNNRTALGCYSTFELRHGIETLPDEPVHTGYNFDLNWRCFRDPVTGVKMRYYWDGDGVLQFTFPDGLVLYNNDCKKTYCWEVNPDYLD